MAKCARQWGDAPDASRSARRREPTAGPHARGAIRPPSRGARIIHRRSLLFTYRSAKGRDPPLVGTSVVLVVVVLVIVVFVVFEVTGQLALPVALLPRVG